VGLGGGFALVSREGMLLTNNVLLIAALGAVLLGTLYPLFLDALDLGKISVGPPYFDTVFVPLMTPAIFLMGIGPLAQWKKATLPALAMRLRWAFAVSAATALTLPFLIGKWTPLVSLGLLLAIWIVTTSVVGLRERLAHADGSSLMGRLAAVPRSYWGMLLAHCGVAVFIVGVTMVKGFEVEQDLRMNVGETSTVGGYTFRFDGVREVKGPNYIAARGTFHVSQDGREVTVMYPEKRRYTVQNQTMTEAAIAPGLVRDLYVSLGEPVDNGAWSVRLYHKPFIDWIWGGCLIMALGGVLAISDRRYRLAWRRKEADVPAATQMARQTVS
jgi:cytochrome c-type biogenesis protein CcmF